MVEREEIMESEVTQEPAILDDDITGRDRLVRNVLSSWTGHLVFVVSGFIIPRMIDHHIGQSGLGVWDFGWSLTSYFAFVIAGISSSVNRYIAKYRAVGDINNLRGAFSSILCFQSIAALVVCILTLLGTWLVPSLLSHRLESHLDDARAVIFLLGISMAVQVAFGPFSGMITGCHRWDLYNGLNAGFHLGIVAGWIISLFTGGGLQSLAWINLAGTVLTELTRAKLACKVCPECCFGFAYFSRSTMMKMLTFGGKSLLTTASRVLLYQTSNLIVVGFLGPAALAIFSRPSGLIRNAMIFVNKFAFVLTPTASCLHAQGQNEELGKLLIDTTKYAVCMVLPMVIFLSIMGEPLLLVWMGPGYNQGLLLAILAAGHLTTMVQQPVWNILAGMNKHGRMGLANLVASIFSSVFTLITLGILHWGLLGAACSIAIPLTMANGIYVPLYACRHLGIRWRTYIVGTTLRPFICVLPYAASLLAARWVFNDSPWGSLLAGSVGGGLILLALYWRYILPDRIRHPILNRLAQRTILPDS